MRLFAQLSWYFRREWRRYLGAIALLVIIAVLQLIPPKVVGIVVDGVTQQHYTAEKVWMWIGALVLIAVMVYLLRYVWRVLLFGASYQLAVELREDFYRQLSRQHPAFYLRHRTGDLIARATNDVDRVVFAAGEGVLTLTVNGKKVTANVGQNLTIDTELMMAYRQDGIIQNIALTGDYENLFLQPGDNAITFSPGFTISIVPRWRILL